jgi:hypothetical protein
MEHTIHNQATNPAEHEHNWQPRPELLQAMRNIASIVAGDDTAVVSDWQITFANFAQRTSITASEVNLVTIDGQRIAERIDIRTRLPAVFAEMTAGQVAMFNTMATTGAIVLDPDEGRAELVSSLPVFEIDTEALQDLYTTVVANAALVQFAGPLAAAKYLSESNDEDACDMGFPDWDEASFWGEGEFEYAATMMRQSGIYCHSGETGLTAEFPWEEGASSALLGDLTSLMTFHADMAHPVAGNGLYFKLDLPVTLAREQLAECANYLNVYETTGVDIPPFFGAWGSRLDNGTVSYTGFWPNCMYKRGTVANIASWCRVRSNIARQAIGNLQRPGE